MRFDQQSRLALHQDAGGKRRNRSALTSGTGTVEAVKVTLADEIAAAEHVLETYRNSWFTSRTQKEWRLWLAGQATLRRLQQIRTSWRVSERNRTLIRDAVKKKRGWSNQRRNPNRSAIRLIGVERITAIASASCSTVQNLHLRVMHLDLRCRMLVRLHYHHRQMP
jgi:hypothetical protein